MLNRQSVCVCVCVFAWVNSQFAVRVNQFSRHFAIKINSTSHTHTRALSELRIVLDECVGWCVDAVNCHLLSHTTQFVDTNPLPCTHIRICVPAICPHYWYRIQFPCLMILILIKILKSTESIRVTVNWRCFWVCLLLIVTNSAECSLSRSLFVVGHESQHVYDEKKEQKHIWIYLCTTHVDAVKSNRKNSNSYL